MEMDISKGPLSRTAPAPSNENSWSSSSYNPPSYNPFPDSHGPAGPANPAETATLHGYYEDMNRHGSIGDRPRSPDLHSPGLESVWSGEGDKEVFVPAPAPVPRVLQTDDPLEKHRQARPKRIFGLRRLWFWALLMLIALLVVGLAAGLGAGLRTRKSSSPVSVSASASPNSTTQPTSKGSSDYNIGGTLNPKYYTNTGAFNGSGIALASQSFGGTTHGRLVAYFQHNSGQIRWLQLSGDGDWLGGTIDEVVAADARNSTPLSAVAYALNQTSTWHVFYIDTDNYIRQKTSSNITNVWVEGPVSAQKLVALDADQVGLQACWYGNDYGDSDYPHTPVPSGSGTSNSTETKFEDVGMHLWYASDNHTFQQMGWRDGDLDWTFQETWTQKDGHAGVGCFSWGPGTVSYVMFVNLEQTVEFWWKDTNTTLASTDQHPINVWTNTSIAVNNVQPSTSLGYTNIFYAQDGATSTIMGYNISWAAENTTILTSNGFVLEDPGVPGTHMSVTASPDRSGGNNLYVFYQTNGSDITEFTRDFLGGQWTQLALPIPHD